MLGLKLILVKWALWYEFPRMLLTHLTNTAHWKYFTHNWCYICFWFPKRYYNTGHELPVYLPMHGYVIKWKHFRRYWPCMWPVNSPHKGRWRESLMFSLICAWTEDWVNKRDAGDLKRHCAHYDVTVMPIPYYNTGYESHILSPMKPNHTLAYIHAEYNSYK